MKQIKWFYDSVPIGKYEITENRGDGKLFLKGKSGQANVKNENGRIYPGKIMRPILDPGSQTMHRVRNRFMKGELEHPQDGMTKSHRASHLVTDLGWLNENDIFAEYEVFNRYPFVNGLLIAGYVEMGVPLGASTRGKGTSYHNGDAEIINDDYQLETIDIVDNPSSQGAYVEPVYTKAESKEIDKLNRLKQLASQAHTGGNGDGKNLNRIGQELLEIARSDRRMEQICDSINNLVQEAQKMKTKNRSVSVGVVQQLLSELSESEDKKGVSVVDPGKSSDIELYPNELSKDWQSVESEEEEEGDNDEEKNMEMEQDKMKVKERKKNKSRLKEIEEPDMTEERYEQDDNMNYDKRAERQEPDMEEDEGAEYDDMDDEDNDKFELQEPDMDEQEYDDMDDEEDYKEKYMKLKREMEMMKKEKYSCESKKRKGLTIQEMRKKYSQLERRYNKSVLLSEELLKESKKYKKANETLSKRLNAATGIMGCLAKRVEEEKRREMIENAIQQNPALERMRPALEECQSTEKLKRTLRKIEENKIQDPAFQGNIMESQQKGLSLAAIQQKGNGNASDIVNFTGAVLASMADWK